MSVFFIYFHSSVRFPFTVVTVYNVFHVTLYFILYFHLFFFHNLPFFSFFSSEMFPVQSSALSLSLLWLSTSVVVVAPNVVSVFLEYYELNGHWKLTWERCQNCGMNVCLFASVCECVFMKTYTCGTTTPQLDVNKSHLTLDQHSMKGPRKRE